MELMLKIFLTSYGVAPSIIYIFIYFAAKKEYKITSPLCTIYHHITANMFLDLLPELLSPILTLLSREDLKNISLCSKACNFIVAPILWESVVVPEIYLLTTTPIPNRIVHCHDLCVQVAGAMYQKERKKFAKKFEALMALSSPTIFRFECMEESMRSQCFKSISKHLTNLENLNISYHKVFDTGLKYIGRLAGLKNLNISSCDLTDSALQHISCLTGLENLDISNNWQISDSGLKHIGNLTGLKNLNISNRHSKITSAGLQHITNLVQLQELDISGIRVKEEGLKYISSLRELRSLNYNLSNCISDVGIRQLKVHLPDLTVLLDF